MRRPFMTGDDRLRRLEGQQYLVLRPTGAVAALYREVQASALDRGVLPHPHTEHVTLRGFYEPERLDDVRQIARAWAAGRGPIELRAEAVDLFPAPWQIVILRLARTADLVAAYADLTAALGRTDLRRLDELAVDDWTFHLSVVYGKELSPQDWEAFARTQTREVAATETVYEAELVWYLDGVEHAEVLPLGRTD
jgi:hypothetical protein